MSRSSLFHQLFPGRKLVVLSNREPYTHHHSPDGPICRQPVGGLVSALDPLLQSTGGTWIAWGSGDADRDVSPNGSLRVPPERPAYTLRRLWLSPEEVREYYDDYANGGLWPLSHLLPERANFAWSAWRTFKSVNRRFAETAGAVAGRGDVVWVNDYQLSLVPAFLRDLRPDCLIAHFWHIPWPPHSIFRLCPQRRELLEGLLGNHLLGFHTPEYAANFLEAVATELDAQVDPTSGCVVHNGRETMVGAFPISIDYKYWRSMALSPKSELLAGRIHRHYRQRNRYLGLAVDRLDYTKGILPRLEGFRQFFERFPAYRGRVTLVQVVVPNRTSIAAYAALQEEIAAVTRRLKSAYRLPGWVPIIPVTRKLEPEHLSSLYRAADFAIVSPIFDGMNLVAKEFVACQVNQRGVLLLSESAGASQELDAALPINPLDPEGFAATIRRALEMSLAERQNRLERMQQYLSANDIYQWVDSIFYRLADLRPSPWASDLTAFGS